MSELRGTHKGTSESYLQEKAILCPPQTKANVCIHVCDTYTHTHIKARNTDQHHSRQSHRPPSLEC